MKSPVTQHMTVHPQRCLNGRGATDFCRTCLDSCPQNAIELTGDGIRFDASRCNDCALCTRDCPTEVFSHDTFSPIDFVNLAEGKNELELHCQFADESEVKSGSLPIPCHGLLDERLLIGLSAVGVKSVHLHGLSKCEACPTRVGAKRLVQTLERPAPALTARLPSVLDDSGTSGAIAGTDDHARRTETPMDRRGFLNTSVNAVAYAALSALPGNLLHSQNKEAGKVVSDPNQCTVKHIPQSHHLTLFNLRSGQLSTEAPGDMPAWFHEVRAQGECDACGICALGCPTGALLIEDADQTLMLHFRSAACIGCGLCTASCPRQALQLIPARNETMILDDRKQALFEFERVICKSCGARFTSHGDHSDLCQSCENEREIHAQWTAR